MLRKTRRIRWEANDLIVFRREINDDDHDESTMMSVIWYSVCQWESSNQEGIGKYGGCRAGMADDGRMVERCSSNVGSNGDDSMAGRK